LDLTRLCKTLLIAGAFLLVLGLGNWLIHRPSYGRADEQGDMFAVANNAWAGEAEAAYRSCLYSFNYPGFSRMLGQPCESSPVTPVGMIGGVLLLAAGGVLFAARKR